MKEILEILRALEMHDARRQKGRDARPVAGALATLVSAEGSSYRRPGARMLWLGEETDAAGSMRTGGISGGCLEEDLETHCREVAATGESRVVTYDTTGENDLVWGVGTGCSGVVRVLVEPAGVVPPMLAFARDALARREAVALATVFSEGQGGKTVLAMSACGKTLACGNKDSPAAGLPPPPHSKIFLERAARECLRGRKSKTVSCAADAYLFIEYIPPPITLRILGSGADTGPLVRMAAELGWDACDFPGEPGEIAPPDERTAAVVMTHRYARDVPLLRKLLPLPFSYVGLLGPRKRAGKILADLEDSGLRITPQMRARLHAPVGLDLGADTPGTIALSILAEIQGVFAARDARPLRERAGAIHDE